MAYNLNDYIEVEDRLDAFYKAHPEARVWTEPVKISDDGTMIIVHAYVYEHKEDINPVSTGLAQEYKGQNGANKNSWVENCETSAIGRALANWKFQGSAKRPSRLEMEKAIGDDSVVPKPASAPKPAAAQKKKDTTQQTMTSPSKNEMGDIILDMCGRDKNFATKTWDFTVARMNLKTGTPEKVIDYTEQDQKEFITVASDFIKKHKEEFATREGNSDVVNRIIENLDDVQEIEKSNTHSVEVVGENDMTEIPSGPWEKNPISDGQKNFLESLITQAIDKGEDKLAAEAKQFINGDTCTQKEASSWIEKLKGL